MGLSFTSGWSYFKFIKARHKSQQKLYDQVAAVEAALKQFIIEAIEPNYLLEFYDQTTTTHSILQDITTLFTALFNNYGDLTTKGLMEKQATLNNYVYNPNTPISKLFNI